MIYFPRRRLYVFISYVTLFSTFLVFLYRMKDPIPYTVVEQKKAYSNINQEFTHHVSPDVKPILSDEILFNPDVSPEVTQIQSNQNLSPTPCYNNGSGIFLLIMVPSITTHFEKRNAIRETWGSLPRFDESFKVVFVVGWTGNVTVQGDLTAESQRYNDLLQINVFEHYKSLTEKSIAILKWASWLCPEAQYLLKADDDMFINIHNLIQYLKEQNPRKSIIGSRVEDSMPKTDINEKYFVPLEVYSGYYPTYIAGTAYVISGDIMSRLYEATTVIDYYFIEDVYITGMCRSAIRARAINHNGFAKDVREQRTCGKDFRNIIAGHQYLPEEIRKIWNDLKEGIKVCVRYRKKKKVKMTSFVF